MCEPEVPADDAVYPAVHLAPASGWMNDPSGLIRFRDRWHVFFQHNPSEPMWGNIHWGHATSDDLVRWRRLPDALAPDDRLGFPFSGTAVVDENNTSGLCSGAGGCLVLVFTHALGELGGQKQSLAYSEDGETFTLFAGNPVLAKAGDAGADFRDPKVFWHEPTSRWVMLVSADEGAEIYTSPNLIEWTLRSTLGPLDGVPAGAWEVPDLFPIRDEGTGRDRWVMKVDVLPGLAQQGETRYVAGAFDGETFTPAGPVRALESGVDFYAGMTFAGTGERRILLGWLSSWAYAFDVPTEPFRGFLSVPRELTLSDGALLQRPVPELMSARDPCALVDLTDATAADASAAAAEVAGHSLDIGLALTGATHFELTLRSDGADEGTVLAWSAERGELTLDRTASGDTFFNSEFAQVLRAPLAARDGEVSVRVIVDLYSVEVFADDGSAVISSLIFPRAANQQLRLAADGTVTRFTVHRFSSAR